MYLLQGKRKRNSPRQTDRQSVKKMQPVNKRILTVAVAIIYFEIILNGEIVCLAITVNVRWGSKGVIRWQ